ncbi:hypothetical protein Scep_004540 [Stephania cephalantha]|uniref:Uncharacterized protein n=1 Tax=Stephania cephalantha TaxID=152367 RepID=A0AAP0KSW9_9MAGN
MNSGEGFGGSDGKGRRLQRQRRQTARASEGPTSGKRRRQTRRQLAVSIAATAEILGFGREISVRERELTVNEISDFLTGTVILSDKWRAYQYQTKEREDWRFPLSPR